MGAVRTSQTVSQSSRLAQSDLLWTSFDFWTDKKVFFTQYCVDSNAF